MKFLFHEHVMKLKRRKESVSECVYERETNNMLEVATFPVGMII